MSTIKKDSGFGVAQIILLISIAILVIFVAWPVLLILFNAFFVDGNFNSTDFYNVLTEPETFQALKNSLIIASMTTIGSTIVGTFFAWLVTRTDLPYKTFMKSLFLVPFMLPSFIGALAWKMLLSPNSGYINTFFMETFGLSEPVFDIYTYYGISAVEVMYLFPFVFIQVCGALERAHGSDLGRIGAYQRCGSVYHYPQNHHSAGAAFHYVRRTLNHAVLHGTFRHCCGTRH